MRTSPTTAYFGRRLRELREKEDIAVYWLAKLLQVTPQDINCFEEGNLEPSLQQLATIAEFFYVTTDYLIGRVNRRYIDTTLLTVEEELAINKLLRESPGHRIDPDF